MEEFEIKSRGHLTCYYCGLKNDKTEAGGIYYCPNPRCIGPGGAWFRMRLKSYIEIDNRHTVDEEEWKTAADEYEKIENAKKEKKYYNKLKEKPWWRFW
jgi:ribosomal protein L37AE/L43A